MNHFLNTIYLPTSSPLPTRPAHLLVLAHLIFFSVGCANDDRISSATTITLSQETLSISNTEGISNLFFTDTLSANINYPTTWNNVELARLARGERFRTVYALRRLREDSTWTYFVDKDVDYEFEDEEPLKLESKSDLTAARFVVGMQHSDSSRSYDVTYDLLASEQGYVYGRIAEYRTAQHMIGNREMNLVIRPTSRNNPYYDLTSQTDFFIDMNYDGHIQERWELVDDTARSSERIYPYAPFRFAGRTWRFKNIHPQGTKVALSRSSEQIAPVQGFRAPPVAGEDLQDQKHKLSDFRGQVVLLEFWSTNCPFSERARPGVNDLVERYRNNGSFQVLSMARESQLDLIQEHLTRRPKSGIQLTQNPSVWSRFNPAGATPTYYLIDRKGTVILRGRGASLVGVIEWVLAREFS